MENLPLFGFTVFEFGHSIAAPYAGEILADLGADVIKIEKPEGDDARKWAPPFWGQASATFLSFNRNKRSIVVDLKNPTERDRLRDLICRTGDVVLQNLKPGAAEKLGFGADVMRKLKPDLIHCTIGAFGVRGPLKDRPGYDPLMQAFAGLMSVTGEPGQSPVRVGTSIVDMATGMWSVIGIVSALLKRSRSGNGVAIDVSLYETAVGWMNYHVATFLGSGDIPGRQGSETPMIVPYRCFETQDSFLVVAAGNDRIFAALARVLGRPDWVDDVRFSTNPARVTNKAALYRELEPLMKQMTTDEWIRLFEKSDIPCAPIQTVEQVVKHPQTEALGILQDSPDSSVRLVGLPVSFDGKRPPFRLTPPALGAHTDEILPSGKI